MPELVPLLLLPLAVPLDDEFISELQRGSLGGHPPPPAVQSSMAPAPNITPAAIGITQARRIVLESTGGSRR